MKRAQRRAVLAAIARREWLLQMLAVDRAYREMSAILRTDQPVAFLFPDNGTHIVHRCVKGLDAPWRAEWLLVSEDLWLENQP